jgi:D-alanyl-D-alanine dipeptidase
MKKSLYFKSVFILKTLLLVFLFFPTSTLAFTEGQGSAGVGNICNNYNNDRDYYRTHPECSTPVEDIKYPIYIKLGVPIPGLPEFSQGQGVLVNKDTFAKYVGGVYKFFVGMAGILAVFMIMFGGVKWLFAGGSSSKISSAKEMIFGAIIGLILALGSYLILYWINPKLVQFAPIGVTVVQTTPGSTTGATGGVCPSDSLVQAIPTNIPHLGISSVCSDPRLLPQTIEKLKTAAASLTGDQKLVITSAYRNTAKQQELYNCYQQVANCPAGCGDCNEAAAPSCSAPHQTGNAIDVYLENGPHGSNLSGSLKSRYNGGSGLSEDQKYLQEKMRDAGFSRYCHEWWHFESVQMSTPCDPGDYN